MHNKSEVTLICNSHVLSSTAVTMTRGMVNTLDITLKDRAGQALVISDIATWELGITQDWSGKTPVLASSSSITAAANVLTATVNTNTELMTSVIDGKTAIQCFITLRGRDADGTIKALYVFPVTMLNVGYTDEQIAAALSFAFQYSVDGITWSGTYTDTAVYMRATLGGGAWTPALRFKGEDGASGDLVLSADDGQQAELGTDNKILVKGLAKADHDHDIKDLDDSTSILSGKEVTSNKVTEIDTEDPSEEKYPSESAVVTELNKKVNAEAGKGLFSGSYADLTNKPTIATDIKDLADSTLILAGKVDKVDGKGLSTNDYTDDDKTKVSNALTSVPDATTSVKGIMQLATSGDTTSTDKAVTPAILNSVLTSALGDINDALDALIGGTE